MNAIPEQLETALALRSRGLLAEAADTLAHPDEYNARVCTTRAELEFSLGRFQDASLSYFSAAIFDQSNPDVLYNLALCLERSGRWDVASETFERVLLLDRQRIDARLGLGACLLHLSRAEEALTIFDQCNAGSSASPALLGRAVALQLLGRMDEARMEYEELLAANSSSEEVLSNLIAMSIETGDQERAWSYSRRLLELCPHSTTALQGLATVALDRRDHQSAASYCDRLLQLAPDCLEAWHNFRIALDRFSFSSSDPALASGGKQ